MWHQGSLLILKPGFQDQDFRCIHCAFIFRLHDGLPNKEKVLLKIARIRLEIESCVGWGFGVGTPARGVDGLPSAVRLGNMGIRQCWVGVTEFLRSGNCLGLGDCLGLGVRFTSDEAVHGIRVSLIHVLLTIPSNLKRLFFSI